MNVQSTDVVNVSAGIELDTAAATLALAFDADPFMRWMYDDPLNYLENIPALFRAIGQESVAERAAQRTADGAGVAFWLPPGVAGASEPIQAVISRSVALDKQSAIGAAMEQTEHYRPREPHWYLSTLGVDAAHRNKGCGALLLKHRLRTCDEQHLPAYLWSSSPQNISFYERHGFQVTCTVQEGAAPAIFTMLREAR